MLGGAGEEHYRQALEILLADPANDGVLVTLVPMVLIDPEAILKTIVSVVQGSPSGKPVLACLMGEASLEGAFAAADQGGLPAYRFPEEAVQAFKALHQRAAWMKDEHPLPSPMAQVDAKAAHRILSEALQSGHTSLDAAGGRALLEAYGLQTPQEKIATNPQDAAAFAARVGFPVALKLVSPDILHKTEVGGVLLDVTDEAAVLAGWEVIMERARQAHPQAQLCGVQVQRMVSGGMEVILGMKRDPVFGPLVMFGLGGIYVEALGEVSFRLAPLSRPEAERMIAEVRSSRLLDGWRGAPPADRAALVDALLRVAQLAADCPQMAEMDINPLIVLPEGQGALAVDVRIILEGEDKSAD
jgi:acetyltransferase